MSASEKFQAFLASLIVLTVIGLHVFEAARPTYTVPARLDDVLLIAAGAMFAPSVIGRLRKNGNERKPS